MQDDMNTSGASAEGLSDLLGLGVGSSDAGAADDGPAIRDLLRLTLSDTLPVDSAVLTVLPSLAGENPDLASSVEDVSQVLLDQEDSGLKRECGCDIHHLGIGKVEPEVGQKRIARSAGDQGRTAESVGCR